MYDFVDLPIPHNQIPPIGAPLYGKDKGSDKSESGEGDDLDLDRDDRTMDDEERSITDDTAPDQEPSE